MSGLLRRWWLQVPMGVLLLAGCFLIALKAIGSARWAEAMDRRRAAGEPLTYEAWLATLPPIDASAAADLRAALAAMPRRDLAGLMGDVHGLARGPSWSGTSPALTELVGALADQAVAVSAVERKLSRPGVEFTTRDIIPPTAEGGIRVLWSSPVPPLEGARECAHNWFAWAMLTQDPVRDLHALAALRRAMSRNDQGLVMIGIVGVQDACDSAYLHAVTSGRCPEAVAAAWIAECPDEVDDVRQSYRMKRLSTAPRLATTSGTEIGLTAFGWENLGSSPPWWGHPFGLWGWAVREGDLAAYEDRLADAERALATGTATAFVGDPSSWELARHPLANANAFDYRLWNDAAIREDATGRIYRVTAALWLGARGEPDASATRALPAVAALLDQGPTRIRLGVESLGGRRIRVAYDLSLPQPGGLDRSSVRVDRCIGGTWRAPDEPGNWAHEGIVIDLPP